MCHKILTTRMLRQYLLLVGDIPSAWVSVTLAEGGLENMVIVPKDGGKSSKKPAQMKG